MNIECPLCKNSTTNIFFKKRLWDLKYMSCENCSFVFMEPSKRLDFSKEKADYDLHQNDPCDEGYRNFLSKLVKELLPFLSPRERYKNALDFGCGPGPTLNLLFEEIGISTEIYDPIYFDHQKNLNKKYDLVSCSEVVEHFYDPAQGFASLVRLLRPGGILGIMTDLFQKDRDFERWHYIRERTHVSFYSKECFLWIAKEYTLNLLYQDARVVIFKADQQS